MASEESLIKLYLSIGETEQHFNTIQSNYRLIASTWTLACLGGIGFVLTNPTIATTFDPPSICIAIALAGSASILILWLLDIGVYQQLLSMFYAEGRVMEAVLPWLPQVRQQTRRKFKGRLARAISSFYFLMFGFLCSVVVVFIFLSNKIPFTVGHIAIGPWWCFLAAALYFVADCSWVLLNVQPKGQMRDSKPLEGFHDEERRIKDYRSEIEAARASAASKQLS